MHNLNRFSKLITISTNLFNVQPKYYIHHSGQDLPRQYNHKWQPWEKKILYGKHRKIIAEDLINYNDILLIPGYSKSQMASLYSQYLTRKIPLSPQNVCALIHLFIRHDFMNNDIFDDLEKQAYRHKGQFKTRSIFGGLEGSLLFNRKNLIYFFLEDYNAGSQKFTFQEIIYTLQALGKNKCLDVNQKLKVWQENFKPVFMDAITTLKKIPADILARICDGLHKINEQDENVWKRLIQLMKYKKGQKGLVVLEKLYQLSGTYESAKELFDQYFEKMSQDYEIISRYNLTQLRYHTPIQLIKFAEENPSDYYPKIRTLVPEGHNAEEWNQKYQKFLSIGAVKEEQQIIKDKSRSFGYAIKERYQALKDDKQDFSTMSKQQFEQLFGSYQSAIGTIKEEDEKIQQLETKQQQVSEEKQQKKKGKGGKGGDKKQNQGQNKQKGNEKQDSHQQKPKQKKQKAKNKEQ